MRNNSVDWNIVYSCNQFCLSKNFPSEPIVVAGEVVVVVVVIRVLIVANIYMGTLVLMNFNNRVA